MSDLKPALTPEEWERQVFTNEQRNVAPSDMSDGDEGIPYLANGRVEVTYDGAVCSQEIPDRYRNALAALALYGQPFGFTHEDVMLLRDVEEDVEQINTEYGDVDKGEEQAKAISNLADRIEALLPPKETG